MSGETTRTSPHLLSSVSMPMEPSPTLSQDNCKFSGCKLVILEPRREKTGLRGFRPGLT